MVEVLQLPRLLSQFLASGKGHEVGLPDQDVGHGLVEVPELGLDLLLDLPAVLDINQNKSLDIAMRKELRSP